MAENSGSGGQPKANIISIASDDSLWAVQTDQNTLLTILADPADWVSNNIVINGSPAVLWQPFVVVFQQISGTGADPTIQVQSINETALMTVQFVQTNNAPSPTNLFPSGAIVDIIQLGTSVYTHLQFTGFTPTQVANTIFTAVTTPSAYYQAFNALPQSVNGTPVPPGSQFVFSPNATIPTQYIYQGWTPTTSDPQQDDPVACDMSMGDANLQGQVIVNGVVVKTYSPGP